MFEAWISMEDSLVLEPREGATCRDQSSVAGLLQYFCDEFMRIQVLASRQMEVATATPILQNGGLTGAQWGFRFGEL